MHEESLEDGLFVNAPQERAQERITHTEGLRDLERLKRQSVSGGWLVDLPSMPVGDLRGLWRKLVDERKALISAGYGVYGPVCYAMLRTEIQALDGRIEVVQREIDGRGN
jgi:hypothetical protein